MLNRKLLIICLLVLLVPALTFIAPALVNAAPPTITITPLQSNTDTNVDYCYGWQSAGTLDSTKDIAVLFKNSGSANTRFDVEGLTNTEVTFYYDSPDCGATQGGNYEARLTETGSTDNNGHDKVTIVNRFTSQFVFNSAWVGVAIQPDATSGGNPFNIANGTDLSVGFHNVAGNSVLTPLDAGNYMTTMEQAKAAGATSLDWINTSLLYIGNANQVNITSTVDPTISLSLSGNTCGLGTLRADALKTCDYTATVQTNAVNGYTGYISQNQGFKNGTFQIHDESDDSKINGTGTLSATYGEYGIGVQTTDTASYLPSYSNDCVTNYDSLTNDLNAKGLGDTNQHIFADYAGPVDGTTHGVTTLCHGVRIKYDTPPGVYSHVVTITAVGNF